MPPPRTNTHAGVYLLPGASDFLCVVEAWGGPGGVGFYYPAGGGTFPPRRGDYRSNGDSSSITGRHPEVFIGPQPPSPVDTPVVLWGDIIHHESTHRLFYSIGPTPRFLQTLLGPYTVVFHPRDPTNTEPGRLPLTRSTPGKNLPTHDSRFLIHRKIHFSHNMSYVLLSTGSPVIHSLLCEKGQGHVPVPPSG